jgi:hypothetical protein
LEFSNIKKGLVWPVLKIKKNKIKEIDIRVRFAKHTLSSKQIGPAGPGGQVQPDLFSFSFFGWV